MNEMTVLLFTSNNQWMAIQKMIRFVFRVIVSLGSMDIGNCIDRYLVEDGPSIPGHATGLPIPKAGTTQ